jgi:pyridoxal biosynthesis lyase PdxS
MFFSYLFQNNLIVEVGNLKEAEIAEKSGVSVLLLGELLSPINPNFQESDLKELKAKTSLPLMASFRPGHNVEAEILLNLGINILYSDNRFEKTSAKINLENINKVIPIFYDIESIEELDTSLPKNYIPILRKDNLEDLSQGLSEIKPEIFLGASGEIETVSDIAFLKRKGAKIIILSRDIFQVLPNNEYLEKLVKASLFYKQSEKLSQLYFNEEE